MHQQRAIAIFNLLPSTLPLARQIRVILHEAGWQSVTLYCRATHVAKLAQIAPLDYRVFHQTTTALGEAFASGKSIIAIAASGIVIRALARHLSDKLTEPPTLAVAADGSAVVPLLGGHHGANQLAEYLAMALKTAGYATTAAITTASDLAALKALDEPPPLWSLAADGDLRAKLTAVAAARLEGYAIEIHCDSGNTDWLEPAKDRDKGTAKIEITISHKIPPNPLPSDRVYLHPPTLALGVGAVRGAKGSDLIALVEELLRDNGLAAASIAAVFSLDLKADEAAVHQLAARLGREARFFTVAQLLAQTERLTSRSDAVYRATGCYGVAEGAALAAVGAAGTLIVAKHQNPAATVTAAIALAALPQCLDPSQLGMNRGRLTVLGIGPGAPAWRSLAMESEIRRAELVVGYGLYLDQIRDLIGATPCFDSPLGQESERAAYALEAAAKGQRVVLVSSGDAGIYGLAPLVVEQYLATEAAAIRRIDLHIEPGISAVQAVAARLGAAIGHDFAVISLSDLMTDWKIIENRLKAAASGDFVTALYNPRSQKRDWQLQQAIDIFRSVREPSTPVAIAKSVGRPAEEIIVQRLDQFSVQTVDMFSLVLIGNSQSRHETLSGRDWLLTPRGYHGRGL